MRTLALILAIMTPCLFAACGDNLPPDEGDSSSVQSGNSEEPDAGPDAGAREIVAELTVTSPDCWRLVAGYEVRAVYTDDGSEVANLGCHLRFANGATSDRCAGEEVVGTPGNQDFVVDVEDLDTGATAHLEQRAFISPRMEINFEYEKPACGLSFDFNLSVPQSTSKSVVVTPADKIVGGDPGPFSQGGHIEATEPGIFTLTAYVEQERANGPLCSTTVTREVEVSACEHDHEPGCGHM